MPIQQATARGTNLGLVLFLVSLASFLTAFSGSSINIALPTIGAEFSLDAVTLSWIPTAYQLVTAVLLLPLGRAADIYGRSRIFVFGVSIFAVSSAVAALSWSGGMLIAARAFQGLSGAMMFSTSGAIVVASFPTEKRGRAIGLNSAAVYSGMSIGPVLGGMLIKNFGWPSVFWLSSLAAAAALPFMFRGLPADRSEPGSTRFDGLGSAVYGLSIAALVYGLGHVLELYGQGLVLLGLCGLAAFGLVESRVAKPIVDLAVFARNRVFAFSNAAAMIHYGATFSIGFFMSLYLQTARGFPPDQAGMVLVVQPVVQALVSPMAGRFSDRIEPRILSSAGLAVTVAGLLALSRLDRATDMPVVLAVLAAIGLGYALFISPNTNAIMSSVEKSDYGLATSMTSTMRLLGQMLSMSLAAMLLSVFIGARGLSESTADSLTGAMRVDFLAAAALCALGIGLSWARGSTRPGGS
jgi:EmrB/QacA subfamily drug resistance transporter